MIFFAAMAPPASGQDLPPEGTYSLFDYLFTQPTEDGRWEYDIPLSIQGIIARMREIQGGEPIVLLVPAGRSVQRLETDLRDPRIVATFNANPRRTHQGQVAPEVLGKFFIGYGRKSDQLEVISYNDRAARFEFQVVQNLSDSRRQKVFYSPRSFCMACHAHEVPIFPRNPWQETASFLQTALAINRARDTTEPYLGIGIPRIDENSRAYSFDRITDRSGDVTVYQEIWRDVCSLGEGGGEPDPGNAAPCRAALLKLAFRYMIEFVIPTQSDLYVQLSRTLQRGLQTHFGDLVYFPITDLNPRNPLTADGGYNPRSRRGGTRRGDMIDQLMHLTTIPKQFDPLRADTSENFYMHHPLVSQPTQTEYNYPLYDPLIDRPKIRKSEDTRVIQELIAFIANGLSLNADFYESLVNFDADFNADYSSIDQKIDEMVTLAEQNKGALAQRGFIADEVLALFVEDSTQFCCGAEKQLPEPRRADQIGGDEQLTAEERETLEHLNTYCGDCHGPANPQIGFLTGRFADIDQDLAQKIFQRTDWERCDPDRGDYMPPRGSHRRRMCSSTGKTARRQILATFKQRYFADDARPCGDETLPRPLPEDHICN